jgi:O-antigen chain-terminating methyltransferase
MVFPDPESVRSQLLGFWRDPEHIRFYHWELIAAIAATFGLEVEWSSHSEQPHRVVPFAVNPPLVRQSNHLPPFPEEKKLGALSLKEKFLRKLGLVTERRIHQMEQRLLEWSRMLEDQSRDYVIASKQLEERTDSLWDVNQTWAWNDNVTLRLRKRSD